MDRVMVIIVITLTLIAGVMLIDEMNRYDGMAVRIERKLNEK